MHYCTPREDKGPYLAMEVGYILDANGDQLTPPESWADYTDGPAFPNDVYGYVPVELIESFIADHGGLMDEFYLLVTATRKRVKGSKLRQSPKNATRITRVAKCSFDKDSVYQGVKTGRWYRLEVFDNPFPHDLDLVFVGLLSDPGVRGAEALGERFETSLNRASKHRWKVANCGPIDAEDAALLRIELEVV
jgi:hypothetical protein